jgi:hypothetical protein
LEVIEAVHSETQGGEVLPNGLRPDQFAYGHPRMPRADRAKIFIPFDALRGYREALRETERHVEMMRQPELSDDLKAELDWQIGQLQPGALVCITYFDDGTFVQARGPFRTYDNLARTLSVGDARIALDRIRNIETL